MNAVAVASSWLQDLDTTLTAQPSEVKALRRAAQQRFEQLGFPAITQEAWRNTNLAPILRTRFSRPQPGSGGLTHGQIEPFLLPGCAEWIFVNGRLVPDLKAQQPALPAGVYVGSLAQALLEVPHLVLPHLGHHADPDQALVALNCAYLEDGFFVYVPPGVVVETPLHALFLSTTGGQNPIATYPRNLIIAGEQAQVSVVETYGGFPEEVYFTCGVTEIVGLAGSVIDHYKLGEEGLASYHLATQEVILATDASCFSHAITHGGALVRHDIHALLAAPGVNCTLNGLYLARGKQQIDHYMLVDHAKPHGTSYELYKGILEDQSRATFNGRIRVHPQAQKTDAKQSNRNLLLSPEALVHSNPQLEIFADDVRCTHGSTTGHLDDEAVFYLRSRGIGEEAAKSLLTYAFAAEVLQEIRLPAVRQDLEEFLFTRLPKGEVVRQAI